jgi:hypothetical protein
MLRTPVEEFRRRQKKGKGKDTRAGLHGVLPLQAALRRAGPFHSLAM